MIGWTICNHNTYQGERHPDKSLRNAFGDPYPYGLCPSHPEVQAYLEALLSELSAYPLHSLQLESYGFLGFPHRGHHEKVNIDLGAYGKYLMGLCFCPACEQAAQEEGFDLGDARVATQRYLMGIFEGEITPPETFSEEALVAEISSLAGLLAMRERVVSKLVLRLSAASALPLNLLGIRDSMVETLGPQVAEVTDLAYFAEPAQVGAATRALRATLGREMLAGIGIEACPHKTDSESNLVGKIEEAWEAGADHLYFYNYGLMPLKSLTWLRAALFH